MPALRELSQQIPASRELSQQIPAPRGKSSRVGAIFWCKSPGVRGGKVMDEIDTCIICTKIYKILNQIGPSSPSSPPGSLIIHLEGHLISLFEKFLVSRFQTLE